MEKKWTYCAVCSIIQIHFVRGVWEKTSNTENIYAFPGSDVNLTCQTWKTGFLVQMQWSQVTDKLDLIALYHPQYGLHCANASPCESLVTFTETPRNVSTWTLHLKNVSSSLTGKYECSFTLYPEGVRTKIYNLLIQTNVTQDEWRSSHIIEIQINQTLEIPCFQNISSEISSEFTFAWLVQEDNGTQETLITEGHSISNSSLFKDRVKLGTDYKLYLSPVQIHDDDRKFSCHFMARPGKILRSSTTVKVFAKPEIPMIVENNSTDVLRERTFTCSLKSVFPTANLTWFIEGGFPQGEEEGSANPSTGPALEVVPSTLGTRPSSVNSVSPTRYPAVSSTALGDVSTLTPNTTLQTSNSNVTTQGFNYSWTSGGQDTKNPASWMPSETYSSAPSGASSTIHGDVFTSTTRIFSEVPATANGSTKNIHIHITGIVANKPRDGMSWPVIVAALLAFCVALFGLGVRKWCQYQKEIMERPPPFKPPPPPIKYTCIQESTGSDPPCHEMETF
ncbi:T-cell surface protein tactile isoform X6 [Ursus maritimus]|uniref:T-cell surface protein tactile isoform X6 n=1 Tax=Ursus maritimus TaxID=29073 RepID=A0A8M1F4W7_URSMA|nr:T-cell surface protein tactile isoform X6 [Ursus maritimus]